MEPQTCTKCHSLPQDILMLSCSHDLCLNCASDRLAFEMKKKKPANSIVCQFCYERTPLDSESVSELQKLINRGSKIVDTVPQRRTDVKTYDKVAETYEKSGRDAVKKQKYAYDGLDRNDKTYEKAKDRNYQRGGNSGVNYQRGGNSGVNYSSSSNSVLIDAGRRQCLEHTDEQILYFCFDCKCECICPECVIHGKHKEHEVKTIKKSHPIVKTELDKSLQKFENNIESLLIKKSEVEKNIRTLNQQMSQSKRQIQQAFDEIRIKLQNKEKQILKTCDQSYEEGLQQLDKYIKAVIKRIQQIKIQSSTIQQCLKRDEITVLNYYSKKWKELIEQSKDAQVQTALVTFPNNQIILASILDLTDQITQIGLPSQGRTTKYSK